MSVSRAFLQPRSVAQPPQGDFEYAPVFRLFEDTTFAGLEAQLNAMRVDLSGSDTSLYVIEEIEYQVVVTKHSLGGMPAEKLYSAMIWATEVLKV